MDWSGYKPTEAEEDNGVLEIKFSRPALNEFIKNNSIKLFSKTDIRSITLDGKPFGLWSQNDGVVTLDLKGVIRDVLHILILKGGRKHVNKHLYYNTPQEM